MKMDDSEIMSMLSESTADWDEVLDMVKKCKKILKPGFKDLLTKIQGCGVPVYIVTKQPKENTDIHCVLEENGIKGIKTLHQYELYDSQIVGGVEYKVCPGKSTTVTKGSLINECLESQKKYPSAVIFADDIEHCVTDVKNIVTTTGASTPVDADGASTPVDADGVKIWMFVYPPNGSKVWKVEMY